MSTIIGLVLLDNINKRDNMVSEPHPLQGRKGLLPLDGEGVRRGESVPPGPLPLNMLRWQKPLSATSNVLSGLQP